MRSDKEIRDRKMIKHRPNRRDQKNQKIPLLSTIKNDKRNQNAKVQHRFINKIAEIPKNGKIH